MPCQSAWEVNISLHPSFQLRHRWRLSSSQADAEATTSRSNLFTWARLHNDCRSSRHDMWVLNKDTGTSVSFASSLSDMLNMCRLGPLGCFLSS